MLIAMQKCLRLHRPQKQINLAESMSEAHPADRSNDRKKTTKAVATTPKRFPCPAADKDTMKKCHSLSYLQKHNFNFGTGGLPTLASLCSDQLCGKAEGIRLGTQMKDSISRRRCHKLKPQRPSRVQNKKFTNRTYLPTRDGHKDAFDMEFALPRLGELFEQSYNKVSLSSPTNPGMCQATLGLVKYGGPEMLLSLLLAGLSMP